MLTGPMRQFIIDKAKKPLHKVILSIGKRWPEPTIENCAHPNSIILINIRDEFLTHQARSGRGPLLLAAFNILICIYEHDIYYRQRFNWFIKKIIEAGWFNIGSEPKWCWDWEEEEGWWKDEMGGDDGQGVS